MAHAVDAPPLTPIEPVTEVLHGVEITDPYRWLEDQNSLRTRKWLEEQTAYTRANLDALPGRERIRARVEELLAGEVISDPWKVGGRYFYLKRSAYQEQPAIVMRNGDLGEETVLVHRTNEVDTKTISVKILNISSDGSLLAYTVSEGANFFKTVEFIDVGEKRVLPDRLPRGFNPQLQFSRDGLGFYYSSEFVDTPRPRYRAVYWHEFGTKQQEDVEVFVAGDNPDIHLTLIGSVDGRFIGYVVTRAKESVTCDLYIQDVSSKTSATKLLEQIPPVFSPYFVGDQLFALTDLNAPNFRIVAIDKCHPEPSEWVDVVRESNQSIQGLTFVGAYICVSYVENASSRIDIFDREGCWRGTVPSPLQGSAQPLWRPLEDETLFYTFSSFQYSPTIFCYHIPSGKHAVWARNVVNFDSSSIVVEQVRFKSRDGTEVPMFLVARKEQRSTCPMPTFLGAYGGFGVSRTPQFNAYSTFLVEHGFLFAFANVRGGGEFGGEWHRAGKRHNRQNAVDDFVAAAEWLIAHGYATPDKIAIGGGSNAGLLTGAAFTQRPDLFRVAICMGPLLDMLRYHRFDSAHRWVDEYGTPELEVDFRHLAGYSPYHRVKEGAAYPAVMLISGDEDTCCNPMHARKMAARLQAATSSGRPVLLDYKSTWGHASVQPLTRRIEALTDRLAFICHALGVGV